MEVWQNKIIIDYLERTRKLRDIGLIKKQLEELLRIIKIMDKKFTKTKGRRDHLRKVVFTRDENKCRLCNDTEELQIHHLTPLAIGGSNKVDNIITLCDCCHKFLHFCNPKSRLLHSKLTKEGLRKAKLNGKKLGRPSVNKTSPKNHRGNFP